MPFKLLLLALIFLLASAACVDAPVNQSPAASTPESTTPSVSSEALPAGPVPELNGTTGIFGVGSRAVEFSQECLDSVEDETTEMPIIGSPPSLPDPAPIATVPFQEDEDLGDRLMAVLGSRADDYAFYVKDLTTGRGAVHDANKRFNAASLYKLFVMYEAFRQQDADLLDWQDEVVITPYYDAEGLSPRDTELCQVLTVSEAIQAMMRVSDNAAAVRIEDLVSSAHVNGSIRALGLRGSGLFSDGLPTTAADIALLLEGIARGQTVSEAASADMISLMVSEIIDNGLTSGVPADDLVAHKTGNWSDATNDAGIVYADWGPYVFVALSATDHETSIIRALSRAAYNYFSKE